MSREPVAAVIGEALIDIVDTGDGATFTAHVGGSPLNVAVGLARLGQPTAFMGRFSNDSLGRVLRRYAERTGLSLTASPSATEPSTIALAEVDEHGVATYDISVDGTADWGWSAAELSRLPPSVEVLHLGSLTSWLPPGAAVVGAFVDEKHAAGDLLISYDPNIRPALLVSADRSRPLIEARIRAAHVVKASAEDVDWLYAGATHAEVARRWVGLGTELIVITNGGDGASAWTSAGTELTVGALKVDVVDTVGAGDAFTSGLLDGLINSGVRHPSGLVTALRETAVLGRALEQAAVVSGLTCARAGANPPARVEVEAFRA